MQSDEGVSAKIFARDYQWEGMDQFPGYKEAAGVQNLLEIGTLELVPARPAVVFDNPNLAVLLNLGAYHPDDPNNRYITLIVSPQSQEFDLGSIRLVVDAVSSNHQVLVR